MGRMLSGLLLPVHAGGAHLEGMVVGIQSLYAGELRHVRRRFQNGILVHADHARAPLELVRPKAGERLARAARGQRMAGARQKIPAGHRGQGPRINGPGRPDGRQHGIFILRHQDQVFRLKA